MTSRQDDKLWAEVFQLGLYDDLIVFSSPSLIPSTFPIEADMADTAVMATPPESNAHIVPMPAWSSFIGVSKFLVAFVTLVLTASAAGIWGNFTALGWTLFACVATLSTGGYYFLALGYKPVLYNRWAVLALETLGLIFWATSLILLAKWTAAYNNSVYWGQKHLAHVPYDISQDVEGKRGLIMRTSAGEYHAGVILAGVATGCAAFEVILFVVTLVVFSINLHTHQRAGHPPICGGAQRDPGTSTTEATEEMDKTEA